MQKILPPILLFLCFALIATVDILLPVAHLIAWPFNLVGILIIVFGIALAASKMNGVNQLYNTWKQI